MSTCGRCGASIVWIQTPAGKSMPCDAQPVYIVQDGSGPEKAVLKGGQVVSCRFTDDPDQATGMGYVPHFATCKPTEELPGIYTKSNPYGYRLDLRHPLVRQLYDRYKDKKCISHSAPLSDDERHDFEEKVIPWLEEHEKEKGRG